MRDKISTLGPVSEAIAKLAKERAERVKQPPQYLIEAYVGYYGDDMLNVSKETVLPLIKAHSPKERLAVYLTWNGILGFTDEIYSIATEGTHS